MIRPKLHQREALRALATARRRGQKKALVVMASGLGKTITAGLDFQSYAGRKRPRVLYLCHQNDILEQAQKEFARIFPMAKYTVGFYHGGQKDFGEPDFLFASFQTMRESRRKFRRDEFDYVIVDESHHTPAPTYEPVIKYFRPKFLLAVTATPERTDLDDIRRIFGQEVYSLPLEDALARGLLTKVDYRLVTDEIAYQKILKTSVGKISAREINRKFFVKKRDQEIVKILKRHIGRLKKPQVMVFCRTTKHCDRLAKMLPGAIAVHYGITRSEQKLRLQMFRAGHYTVVLTVDKFNEGIDVPEANLIVFLRSTVSPIVFYQQLGRGLRPMRGKKKVVVLDFVANCERLITLDKLWGQVQKRAKKVVKRRHKKTKPFEVNVGRVQFTEAAKKVLEILHQIREGYTREMLIRQLQKLQEKLGRPLMADDLDETCASKSTFWNLFGSFRAALVAAGLEAGKLIQRNYSRQELLGQLRAVARKLGRTPTSEDVNVASKHGECVSAATFARRFGSHNAALRAAKLEVQSEYEEGELIQQLKHLAKKLGRSPRLQEVNASSKAGDCATGHTFVNHFGSFNEALKAAGLSATHKGRGMIVYSHELLAKQMLDLERQLGHPPTAKEVEAASKRGLCASVGTYRKFFGSIREARNLAKYAVAMAKSKSTA